MTIKELLAPARHGLHVHIIYLGEAENAETLFGGTREQALETRYAEYEVDSWEPATLWTSKTEMVIIYTSMRGDEIQIWYGGK